MALSLPYRILIFGKGHWASAPGRVIIFSGEVPLGTTQVGMPNSRCIDDRAPPPFGGLCEMWYVVPGAEAPGWRYVAPVGGFLDAQQIEQQQRQATCCPLKPVIYLLSQEKRATFPRPFFGLSSAFLHPFFALLFDQLYRRYSYEISKNGSGNRWGPFWGSSDHTRW